MHEVKTSSASAAIPQAASFNQFPYIFVCLCECSIFSPILHFIQTVQVLSLSRFDVNANQYYDSF